jgi:hypothetical protein
MSGDNSEWGWDLSHPDDGHDGNMVTPTASPKHHSANMHQNKFMSPAKPSFGDNKGITSSPSFNELEHAIGATLALSMNGSMDEQQMAGSQYPSPNRPGGNISTNQKWKQQQRRQQMQKQHQIQTQFRPNPIVMTPMVSAKDEFSPLILDQTSRALVLFHSPYINQIQIRDACQKFGILFYIRPEFHSRGVTLVGYYDVRCAVKAFTELGSALVELGTAAANTGVVAANAAPSVEGSVHYTVMLHYSNNSDESQLLVRQVPENVSEQELNSTFSKFGDIKHLQRVALLHPGSPRAIKRTDSVDSLSAAGNSNIPSNDISVEINDVIIEYYNIQDSTNVMQTFGGGKNNSTTVGWASNIEVYYIQIEVEKLRICRQVIQLLSKWKSEMSGSPYSMPVT